jgi:hypothetical protein
MGFQLIFTVSFLTRHSLSPLTQNTADTNPFRGR